MIKLQGIHYQYPGTDGRGVLNGIDLSIEPGEYVFVCGRSGSGKSSLGYLFNGLIPHFFGGTLRGAVAVDGADTRKQSVSELFARVGLVLQNADAQLFNSTVEYELAFGLESLGLSPADIDRRIERVTETLNLQDLLHRSPTALSGGEKRLVAIASVLCLDPSVLLLDEPFAHLDWEGSTRVRHALRAIHGSGKTVVLIEQRVDGFLQDATRCLILKQGAVIFDGPPKVARRVLQEEHLIPYFVPRKRRVSPHDVPILMARNVIHWRDQKEILRGISLEVGRGETLAIVGRNGAGKTTLIKHFNGLLRPTRGEVIFMGEVISRKTPPEMATSVGLAFQNPNDQFFKYRVRDELLAGPRRLGIKCDGLLEELCDLFQLRGLLDRSPYRLSEGEKKRVALASVLAVRPQVLVLDEPTVGQDGQFLEAMAGLLAALQDRGLTTVIVTHDLEFAMATADRWIVLHDGRVAADGSPEELICNERLTQIGALGRHQSGPITSSWKLAETRAI